MVDRPGFTVEISESPTLSIDSTTYSSRIRKLLDSWVAANEPIAGCQSAECLPISIRVAQEIAPHKGLGSGTQLALAMARGLHEFFEFDSFNKIEAAKMLGRADRSGVGTVGFHSGGLIVDSTESIHEYRLPDNWRVLLIIPRSIAGLSGDAEVRSFETLIEYDERVADQARQLVHEQLLPALEHDNFDEFALAITDYGKLAGGCFAKAQNGLYNGPIVTSIIEQLVHLGSKGIGQSSWGPCVFCWFDNDETAAQFLVENEQQFSNVAELFLVSPLNTGASVTRHEASNC